MITSTTPYKLAEIYRMTWPQLYRTEKTSYNGINNSQKLLRNMKFTVYSKEGCPYCTKIQQVLELSKLEHKVYKLNEDFTKEQFYAEFGNGSTFPQVVMNDKHLGGCTDTVKYLQENKVI